MKYSFDYAFSINSDISAADKERVMKETWSEMEKLGVKMRQRVTDFGNWVMDEPLETIEGFDYAITGITEYPRENVIYDYWKCVEVLIIRDGLSEDDAIDKMDKIIDDLELDGERSPIVMQPMDLDLVFVDEEDQEFDMKVAQYHNSEDD